MYLKNGIGGRYVRWRTGESRTRLIVWIIIVVAVVIAVGGLVFLVVADEHQKHYYEYTETGGEIEEKYTAMGDLDTEGYSERIDGLKMTVRYPAEMEGSDRTYPMVLFANGTGSTAEKTYIPYFKHLASWGFIVVGNDDENTRTGESIEKCLVRMLELNDDPDSVFHGKIDVSKIGVGGHSQGGCGAINAATNQPHGDMIKAIYTVSCTSSYHTAVLDSEAEKNGKEVGWAYDISKVAAPTLILAGTGSWDAGTATSKDQVNDDKNHIVQGIAPLWSLQENYGLIPDDVDKLMARKANVDHGDSYLRVDGYTTAWLLYELCGDQEAARAFVGGDAEILRNSLFEDVSKNM